MSATIHDVARQAGVSISTVSRVLNGTSPVKEEKRKLVLEAAEMLGYVPNPAALSLLNKRTGGIGVVLPFVTGEFFSELLSGLDETAQSLESFLIISTSHSRPTEFRKAVLALDKRVDGLVVMAPALDVEEASSLVSPDTPVVFINTHAGEVGADVFNFDNFGGARALTRHLLEDGHERIAVVRGPETAWDAQERVRGYRSAMRDAGFSTDGLEFEGGFTRGDGYTAAESILRTTPRPTAILAANDYCAFGALSALRDAGIEVPREMSVCGFDGLTSSQYAAPPLTTVQVPIREIGHRAIRQLVARVRGDENEQPPNHETVPVELVVRGSTAARTASRG
ncbi:MAG: LacI family DNA-binding transcriptional regulator [Bacteroidota bacterium]